MEVSLDTALYREHIKDLRRSGLTDETIRNLGIYSAGPDAIEERPGWFPRGVRSGLVFPYPGEDGFCRIKVFPPVKDKQGHTVRYLQPQKSGVHLYRPPLAEEVLNNPSITLGWTEGEKKAAKACQEGIPCIGLGGLWSCQDDGKPLPKLADIAHAEREEVLFPDSDVWVRLDLMKAVYAFGKELETRGAKVLVAIIPPGPDGEKRGLDDYLVAMEREGIQARDALASLKRIPLKHQTFSHAARWWRDWAKRKEAPSGPPPDALKLLENFGQVRRVHPAQDFVEGILSYGIPIAEEVLFVTSEQKLLRADELSRSLVVDNRGFDLCRFSKEGIEAFMSGATAKGHRLLKDLEAFFSRFVVFRDPRLPLLLAAWTMGTYTYRIFRVFPYLAFRSPIKRCGKSRTLDVLGLVSFNASSRTTNPTEAQLFRGPARNGGTLLLDEVEDLKTNKEAYMGLLTVLNSGFESGGIVTRQKPRHGDYEEVSFPTYAPRALAGIGRLAETLEDRAILIFMARKLRGEKVERFSPSRLEADAQALRDQCYTWALTHAADIAEVYEAGTFPSLDGLDDRAQDLWEPLISIALLADEEADAEGEMSEFAKTLTALALDLADVRDEGDSVTAKLIAELLHIVEVEGREAFTPTELRERLNLRGFNWIKSTKFLAGLLNPLGFVSTPDKVQIEGRWKSVRRYHLRKQDLNDLHHRYGASEEPSGSAEPSGESDSSTDGDGDDE